MIRRWRLWRAPVLRMAWALFWMAWALAAVRPAAAWGMGEAVRPGLQSGAQGAMASRASIAVAGLSHEVSLAEPDAGSSGGDAAMTPGIHPGTDLAPSLAQAATALLPSSPVDVSDAAPSHACCADEGAATGAGAMADAGHASQAPHAACLGCQHCPDGCAPVCALWPVPPAWFVTQAPRLWHSGPEVHAIDVTAERLERPPRRDGACWHASLA